MKYEKPELMVLTKAINAIENAKNDPPGDPSKDASPAYEDWEE